MFCSDLFADSSWGQGVVKTKNELGGNRHSSMPAPQNMYLEHFGNVARSEGNKAFRGNFGVILARDVGMYVRSFTLLGDTLFVYDIIANKNCFRFFFRSLS